MSTPSRFNGVFTALVTPFTDSGEIDWPAFDALIDRQLSAGIKGLVPVGTTGEAATLSEDEALALVTRTVERAKGQAYILAGTGSNATDKTIKATKRAADAGADGVLLVAPYYNKPSQAGLIAHYEAVADCAPIDNVLYSVPGRSGIAIEIDTVAHLSKSSDNIVAIKEAGGDAARVTDLRLACGKDFSVHCGDDGLALAFYALGAAGLTSVLSNYAPELCVSVYDAWASGDTGSAISLHESAKPLADAMFTECSPSAVKYAMSTAGMLAPHTRLPIVELSASAKSFVQTVVGKKMVQKDNTMLG